MVANLSLRSANPEDRAAISSLISFEYYVHRHLDWRTPLDWLGYRPYWLLERKQQLLAALACPEDPPEIAWIRLFASSSFMKPEESWDWLFNAAVEEFRQQGSPAKVAALALQEWFARLLQQSGFEFHQDIVVLEWKSQQMKPLPLPSGVQIREMKMDDIPAVQVLDNLAFDLPWRISLDALTRSFQQAAYASVAELSGEIIGYQISTQAPMGAHLARLAVRPDHQCRNIGFNLVHDLHNYFQQRGISHITVNTQSNNRASMVLYKKLNYQLTGEKFPVYIYPG